MDRKRQQIAVETIIDAMPRIERNARLVRNAINTAVSKANPMFLPDLTARRMVTVSSYIDRLTRELSALYLELLEDRAALIAPGLVASEDRK